ncbi:hypothetical protein [Azospirillum canadense]|nr:hypothetical protein [Azospirillum canadense]MCW2240366.1 hypothetical protein [Azospirillum canadense]
MPEELWSVDLTLWHSMQLNKPPSSGKPEDAEAPSGDDNAAD